MSNSDDWKQHAAADYRQRRAVLIEIRKEAQAEVDRATAKAEAAEQAIQKLDDGARVFELPVDELRPVVSVRGPNRAGLTLRDALIRFSQEAYPNPVKAADLQAKAEQAIGKTVHWKSTGMSLTRLKDEGIVRRDGHKWYFVPESQRSQPVIEENAPE